VRLDKVSQPATSPRDLQNQEPQTAAIGDVGPQIPVYRIQPLTDPRWDQFLCRHPRSTVFHTSAWLRALRLTYGYEPVVFTTSRPGTELQNGFAASRVSSWITGNRLVSLPFSDHCDPLIDSDAEEQAIFKAVERDAFEQGMRYIEMRPLHPLCGSPGGLYRSDYAYTFHEIDLRPDLDTLLRGCHKDSTQRKISRAHREGLRYEEGRSKVFLDRFYDLLMITRRRHQVPPQPRKWFENLIDCFGDALKIRLAWKDQQPLAAILTLRHKDCLVYKYGCSDAQFNNLGGMHLLFWRSIQEAKQEGATVFDLGRSECENKGLITFKDRWGARRFELLYSRFVKSPHSRDSFRFGGDQSAYGFGKRVFAHLPDSVQCSIGNLLYRHIG
jgi:CelD/BcsL family acetyltransferase involved in cellulose biosynthesis